MLENSGVTEQLAASQEVLSSMELVSIVVIPFIICVCNSPGLLNRI
jgi:hypothetical protein